MELGFWVEECKIKKQLESLGSVEVTEKGRKNKGERAKDLVTFQIGPPGCSKDCWCWAGRDNVSHLGIAGPAAWAEKAATSVMCSARFQEAHLSHHLSSAGLLWYTHANQQAHISRLRQCF